jgi:hypothetical protein
MTPKEKAKELVGRFYVNIPLRDCDNKRPHKLALIAVEELIYSHSQDTTDNQYYFWQEVKQEIENYESNR